MATNWTENQKNAIDLQNKNILVSASAGSGKTAVLVERVINKIIKYKIDIDKIMVVTFTNAAANELKERLLKAIYSNLEKNPKDTFLKRQIKLLSRANITTMDSFCIGLVRSNFHVLNIDPNFKICDDSMSAILKNKAMSTILEKKYIDDNVSENNVTLDLYKILEIFGGKDEKLVDSLFKIYGYIQSFPFPFKFLKESIDKYNIDENIDLVNTDFGKKIYDEVIDDIKSVIARCEILREEVVQDDEFKKHVMLIDEDINFLKSCVINGTTWDKLHDLVKDYVMPQNLRNKVANEKLKEKIKDFRNDIVKAQIKSIKNQIYEKSEKIIHDNKIAYEYLTYLYSFLETFDKEYSRLKQEENLLEFDDVRHLALKLLVSLDDDGNLTYTKIAEDLKEKFEEVYTDEYQDTNLVQETILSAVSKGNNRFIVGDIKQSIYMFIQARPELFNKKYDTYNIYSEENLKSKNDIKIILAENFRSRKSVLDSINYIFEKIMSKKVGDCNYEDVETLKNGATWYDEKEGINYKTELNIVDTKLTDEEKLNVEEDETLDNILELKKFEKEAMVIAERVLNLKKEFKVFVPAKDKEKSYFRDTNYSDIVVLLRGIKSKGVILEDTLKKYGIPAYCDANSSLFTSDELRLVMAFLKITDNPYQDVEMISVMYSIIGKFSLDELCNIRLFFKDKTMKLYDNLKLYLAYYEENSTLIDEKINNILNKIKSFLGIIEEFKNYSKIYSISELLIRLYKQTNIYYQIAIKKNSDLSKANLDLLIDIAREFESSNSSNILSFIKYIDNLEESGANKSQAKVLGDNEDVVKIMTIHKSKGLEFPIVILADTSKKYKEDDINNTVVLQQDLGIGIDVVNNTYNVLYPSVIKEAIKSAIIRQTRSEELRILYVALTRAKEKLIIFGNMNDYEKYVSNEFLLYDEKKIDSTLVLKNDSYLKNILLALNDYENSEGLFDINIIRFNKEKFEKINEIKSEEIEDISIKENINSIKDKRKTIEEKYNKIKEKEKEVNKENERVLKANLEYIYPFSEDVISSNRVSVSKLKKDYLACNFKDEENNTLNNFVIEDNDDKENIDNHEKEESIKEEIESKLKEDILLKFEKPSVLNEEKKYTAVRKGTLIHFILEILDFNKVNTKEELKKYIEDMKNSSVINEDDIKHINITKIYNFLNSDIGKEIKKSSKVKREDEFVVSLKKYSNSLIQGVIDLYYENDDGDIVLLDFKTDRISKEEMYISRYKLQLDIYKDALELLTGKKVVKKYIYSFYLDKKIEVE